MNELAETQSGNRTAGDVRSIVAGSLLAYLDRIPPPVYAFLARDPANPSRLLTNKEIALRGGLSQRTVQRLVSSPTWARATVSTIDAYLVGCGFAALRQAPALWWLRRITERGEQHIRHLTSPRVSPQDCIVRASRLRQLTNTLSKRKQESTANEL